MKEIESGERDKSAAAMDERMSASRREGKTGTSEADLPKDAASLYWYDAESTSYLSTEADNQRQPSPSDTDALFGIFPCRHLSSACSLPQRGDQA